MVLYCFRFGHMGLSSVVNIVHVPLNIWIALSRWCVSNRKKARQIVEKWDKTFRNAQREQRVAFLYLANDILQNSRRKGSEFVNEFWKFLPAALKHVYENGDDNGKKAACRLVTPMHLWRKHFCLVSWLDKFEHLLREFFCLYLTNSLTYLGTYTFEDQ